jgi:branched-chain amino acid transport system permease protein
MEIFLQQIVNGLVQGSIYALVALGYTMVYGIMGLINFAHGEVVMIGTLVTISLAGLLAGAGLPPALAGLGGLLGAVLVCMALGWGLERIAYRPLRNAPRLTPLITAIGMSIVLQNVAMMVWGRSYLSFPALLPKVDFELGEVGRDVVDVGVRQRLGDHVHHFVVALAVAELAQLAGEIGLGLAGQRRRAGHARDAVVTVAHHAILGRLGACFQVGGQGGGRQAGAQQTGGDHRNGFHRGFRQKINRDWNYTCKKNRLPRLLGAGDFRIIAGRHARL